MTIVFVTNFYNHHQAPFATAMDKITEGHFWFIETATMDAERIHELRLRRGGQSCHRLRTFLDRGRNQRRPLQRWRYRTALPKGQIPFG